MLARITTHMRQVGEVSLSPYKIFEGCTAYYRVCKCLNQLTSYLLYTFSK